MSNHGLARVFAACTLLVAPVAIGQETIGSKSQPLTTSKDVTDWTGMNNEVPVCWQTLGFDREKAIVRESVTNTWELWANLRFTGWGFCPTSGPRREVRMRIVNQGTANAGAGGSAREGTAALSASDDNNPGVNFSFNPDGSANEERVEYVAVHEFGHVLGFIHEQDAPGNEGPAQCNLSVDEGANAVPITHYDRDSVMNYCNGDGNSNGHLTDVDIEGVHRIYGVRNANLPSMNPCASSPGKQMASLAAPWQEGDATNIAVFPSDGSKFLSWSQFAVRDGGWMNSTKWASGDFNGDGRSDLAAIWNLNGHNVLTVRSSNGTAFHQAHWLENGGGFVDTTAWMAGDYNADGRADLAGAWNNAGRASIAVYLSGGASFPGWNQWADRDGGWSDDIKWVSGDFNGDGRTDVGAAWNNDGLTTLTVRISDGSRFSHQHWSLNAGRWWKSSTFLAGDFNGDGRDDIVQLWNDVGRNSIKVSLSTGSGFGSPMPWSRRDGGWGALIKWVPGDFNGDGRTDIGAIWNNGGSNTMTVRTSDGIKFTPAHWAQNWGGWMDQTVWCAGKYQ